MPSPPRGKVAEDRMRGAFPAICFLPTGGVNEENILDYLACDKVVAVGGSFMMKGDIRAKTAAVVAKIAKFTEEKR